MLRPGVTCLEISLQLLESMNIIFGIDDKLGDLCNAVEKRLGKCQSKDGKYNMSFNGIDRIPTREYSKSLSILWCFEFVYFHSYDHILFSHHHFL